METEIPVPRSVPLNRRQGRLYYVVCDIYIPEPAGIGDFNEAGDFHYPSAPSLRGILCMHTQSQEDNNNTPIGRGEGDYAENIDRFKFSRDVPIEDSYLLHVRSLTEADDGVFYVTLGASNDRPARNRRRANQRKVSAKKVPKPAYLNPPPVYREDLI